VSENVFNILGMGRQSGDFTAPGAAVAATLLYPVEEPMGFELDRGSAYPKQDRGRNVRNNPGSGYHGVRGASTSLASQARYEDIMDPLEMLYAGDISPVSLGGGLYRWDYPFEPGAPTVVPYTLEGGNIDDADAQMRLVSSLISQMTLGFPDITAPGAAPWTLSADVIAFDREIAEVTPAIVARPNLEVAQGHLTRLYEGDTTEAFAALAELVGHLKSFTMTANKSLTARAYGGADDLATKFGYTETANATFEAKIGISATSRSDFHDIWNATAPTPIGERRWRLANAGSGGRALVIDGRVGLLGVPYDEADGERLFKVTGEFVDDSALDATHQISVTNTVASLA
jgi:hypothetical protein